MALFLGEVCPTGFILFTLEKSRHTYVNIVTGTAQSRGPNNTHFGVGLGGTGCMEGFLRKFSVVRGSGVLSHCSKTGYTASKGSAVNPALRHAGQRKRWK